MLHTALIMASCCAPYTRSACAEMCVPSRALQVHHANYINRTNEAVGKCEYAVSLCVCSSPFLLCLPRALLQRACLVMCCCAADPDLQRLKLNELLARVGTGQLPQDVEVPVSVGSWHAQYAAFANAC